MYLIDRKRHRELLMGIVTCILWREFFGVRNRKIHCPAIKKGPMAQTEHSVCFHLSKFKRKDPIPSRMVVASRGRLLIMRAHEGECKVCQKCSAS